jgi:type I restriction-modification system DNA methylase subunit
MSGDTTITWLNARPSDALPTLGEFDLVVSSPPWGMQAETLTITEAGRTFEVRDSKTYTFILESARHLTKQGVGLFLVPNGFFFQQGRALVRDALPKLGLHLNAVIALPAGTFAPFTNLALNIVLISRTATPDLFVCQLTVIAGEKRPQFRRLCG